MKKIATLALISAAALSLAACGGDKTSSNTVTTIDNETVLNSEDAPIDNFGGADVLGNSGDNLSIDSTSTTVNSTTVNSTTVNTVE